MLFQTTSAHEELRAKIRSFAEDWLWLQVLMLEFFLIFLVRSWRQ